MWRVPYLKSIFFLILTIPAAVLAQKENSQPYVEGYVLDAQTKEPIPFATVKVKAWAKGVVSNRNGSFKIPKKFAELNDTLVISSMGYKNNTSLLMQMMATDSNIILLQPQVYGLEEVIVRANPDKELNARTIVRKAIRAIPENYPNQPFSLIGYYRDYQWHENDYLNLNEAILSIYDQGFESVDVQSTEFSLHKILSNKNFAIDTISSKPYDYENQSKVIDMAHLDGYGGNELRILRVHDAIRNYRIDSYSFVYKLKSQFVSRHSFTREQDIFLDDESFYKITFTKSFKGYSAFGQLVINKENFSIYKLEYALFFKKSDALAMDSADSSKRQLIFEVLSEYRPFKSQMYLNYITFNNAFLLPEPPRFFVEELHVEVTAQRLTLKFNKPVDTQKASITSNYYLKFFDEPLPIAEVFLDKSSRGAVRIYPKFESLIDEREFYDYFRRSNGNPEAMEKLRCDVINITDIDGNLINEVYDFKEYQQYRELFTQEVRQGVEVPDSVLLMNMNKPVFEGQPVQEKDDLDDYWMNTPLKVVND